MGGIIHVGKLDKGGKGGEKEIVEVLWLNEGKREDGPCSRIKRSAKHSTSFSAC